MPGYLLDNNHVSAVCAENPKVMAKLNSLPADAIIRTSVIVLGETEAGHQSTTTTDQKQRDKYNERINKLFLPDAYGITPSTRLYYGKIMGELWRKNPPNKHKLKTEHHLVLNCGVDINDVWCVAVAYEHGLTFVTRDKMVKIKDALNGAIPFDCWI